MAGFQRNVKKAWDNSQDPNLNHAKAREGMFNLLKRGLMNSVPGLAAFNFADDAMSGVEFKDGIRTNEQAINAGQPHLSPSASRISNNDMIPARIPDYGGGLAQVNVPGAVDPMAILAATNAAANNIPVSTGRSNADFMAGVAADAAEAEAIKEMGVDDSVKPKPKAKPKAKAKRKTKTKAKAKTNKTQEAINNAAGITPKRRMTHTDRLAILDPEYAQDPDYGIVY